MSADFGLDAGQRLIAVGGKVIGQFCDTRIDVCSRNARHSRSIGMLAVKIMKCDDEKVQKLVFRPCQRLRGSVLQEHMAMLVNADAALVNQ